MISNALKFTPSGGSVKLVSSLVTSLGEPIADLEEHSIGDVHFHFEVHDTGPGISAVSENLSLLRCTRFCLSSSVCRKIKPNYFGM